MHRGGWRSSGSRAVVPWWPSRVVWLLVAGCGTPMAVEVSPPVEPVPATATPDTGAPTPSESGQAAPEIGECRGPVDLQIIDAAADTRSTVECGSGHGSETFWVGEMDPAIDAWPGADERAGELLNVQVDQECSGRHLEYLGFDADGRPQPPAGSAAALRLLHPHRGRLRRRCPVVPVRRARRAAQRRRDHLHRRDAGRCLRVTAAGVVPVVRGSPRPDCRLR